MKSFQVMIEVNGANTYVGDIMETAEGEAAFCYRESYLSDSENRPISLSLPLQAEPFDARHTRNFFEGLLPEGFTRRCVAEQMHADAGDYISILGGLGKECLGAVQILDPQDPPVPAEYRILTDQDVKDLAREGASESAQLVTKAHLSLTGASGKVGLYYDDRENRWCLPLGTAPSTHIVKQSHIRLKRIVTNEQLCLLAAQELGIQIADSFILNLGQGADEDVLFATKRYDRKWGEKHRRIQDLPVPYRLHQEDFAQALGIPASMKYEKGQGHYLEKMFRLLRDHSASPMEDQLKLWDICIYNVLVGNTDNHIKNLSLLYSEDMRSIRLAPAYDIVSTMIYRGSTDIMALSIGGIYEIRGITREAFEKEAELIGLGWKTAGKRLDFMVQSFDEALNHAKERLIELGFSYADEISEQILEHSHRVLQ